MQPISPNPAPPPLRIVRRRTIDVDEDAAGMVASAHDATVRHPGADLMFKALAFLAIAAVAVAVLAIW
jgi:hypothetical protein